MKKLLNYLSAYKKEAVLAPLFKMLEARSSTRESKTRIWLTF